MLSHLQTISNFFEEEFLGDENEAELHHFDGTLYWWVYWLGREQMLFFSADFQQHMGTYPILETVILDCTSVKVASIIPSGHSVLSFHREDSHLYETDSVHVMITKTTEGRISFAANIRSVPVDPA
jgi:hypothetical protein